MVGFIEIQDHTGAEHAGTFRPFFFSHDQHGVKKAYDEAARQLGATLHFQFIRFQVVGDKHFPCT